MPILLETAYLPPIGYMAEVLRASKVIIEVNETYQKQTFRNHCSIYGPNGKQILSIPVVKVYGNHTTTKDIRISDHQPWQKIHWRSIETAYNNSPFFLFYQDVFAPFYEKKFGFLVDWNLELLNVILKIMKIEVQISLTSRYEKYPLIESGPSVDLNLKNTIGTTGVHENLLDKKPIGNSEGKGNLIDNTSFGISNTKGNLIDDKSFGISDLKNNPDQEKTGGMKDLRDKLIQKNTDMQMEYPGYTQVFEPRHGFIPGLSAIDAIFNLGPETGDYLGQVVHGCL